MQYLFKVGGTGSHRPVSQASVKNARPKKIQRKITITMWIYTDIENDDDDAGDGDGDGDRDDEDDDVWQFPMYYLFLVRRYPVWSCDAYILR